MRHKNNEAEDYLRSNPHLLKWINECLCCHIKGYKPEMEKYVDNIQTPSDYAKKNIKNYFNPLSINDDGLCEDCERVIKYSK